MERFQNRYTAGKLLAKELKEYSNHPNIIVLALPRGGVPVASEIAKALSAPLDVFIVRKLGVPDQEELAMGALATGDVIVYNKEIINNLDIKKSQIEAVIKEEKKELERRNKKYRGTKPFPQLKDKIIILVDDGIATGATIRAAIKALKQYHPAKIIVAVPVAELSICEEIASLVDEMICPMKPRDFHAVGIWYETFEQTEDEEVYDLLKLARST